MNIVVNFVNIVHTSQKRIDRPVCWWNVWTASHQLPQECSPWSDPLRSTGNSSSTQKSFSSPFSLCFPALFRFFWLRLFDFTLVSHEEIRCRLASAWCDRLYRAEVSKATGPTSAHSREAVQYPSSRTKCNDQKFLSFFFNICSLG